MYSYEIDIIQHSSRRSGRRFRGYASLRGVVAVRGHQLVLQPRHPHRQHHRFICNGTACQLLQRESSPSDGYGRRLRRVYNIQHLFTSEHYSSSKREVRFRRTLHLGDRPPVHRLRRPRLLCRRKTEITQSLPLKVKNSVILCIIMPQVLKAVMNDSGQLSFKGNINHTEYGKFNYKQAIIPLCRVFLRAA